MENREESMRASAGKRVLMLLENAPYPIDVRVSNESNTLTKAGYRVSVICRSSPGQPLHEIINGVAVYRYPAPPAANGMLSYLYEYGYSMVATFVLSVLILLRNGFDIVHAHNPPDTFAFIAAIYKSFGKRFVYDHHDLSPEMYEARFDGASHRSVYRALTVLERFSCRLADRVIATNESYKEVEMRRDRVPEDLITIVRNGPDPDRKRAVCPDPDLKQRAGIILGYAGIMGHQDGVDYLLRALWHLVHDLRYTDFYCVIVGTGDVWARLKQLATSLQLDDHVWFTGWVSDEEFLRYLSTADICAVPDPANPFTERSTMIKVMDYMALGKPIVAFDLPEHRRTAHDAAIYVKPNDELEFAKAIAYLIDHPEKRDEMGKYARRRVEQELAWRYSAEQLLAAYQALAPDRASHDLG
jgi:glycosyltransferase involved in cell wall biosynthesis